MPGSRLWTAEKGGHSGPGWFRNHRAESRQRTRRASRRLWKASANAEARHLERSPRLLALQRSHRPRLAMIERKGSPIVSPSPPFLRATMSPDQMAAPSPSMPQACASCCLLSAWVHEGVDFQPRCLRFPSKSSPCKRLCKKPRVCILLGDLRQTVCIGLQVTPEVDAEV